MVVLIIGAIMIASCIWWYTDLYKIITNFNNKLLVKNKIMNMCISTILNIILLILVVGIVDEFI
ncbi:hypothetical protein LGK97_14080 [Clostridium sp. CS001]|uniref:hypothetical protein n=1 Tax=Clostridium sp. CS001 TaxID=2880648 RepID=UPI001CF2185D|nr:hypothetical protein [Clostridium sp. CS001]MCB2290871.1 hypothetical protein [Clostridium sp. CS001]